MASLVPVSPAGERVASYLRLPGLCRDATSRAAFRSSHLVLVSTLVADRNGMFTLARVSLDLNTSERDQQANSL